jgi:hypothetical protein
MVMGLALLFPRYHDFSLLGLFDQPSRVQGVKHKREKVEDKIVRTAATL